jgi:serine/threonine-protein kinase HipA
MRERRAEVWTRQAVQPMKMGSLYVSDTQCRFTYDLDYLHAGLPGLGRVYAPEFFGENTIKRARSQAFDFLPPLQALIPPHAEDNFIRRLVVQALQKKGVPMRDRFEQDWEILMLAGHGGIGHIDVFASDDEARAWYAKPSSKLRAVADAEFGFSLKEFLTWFDEDAEHLLSIIGPTPSVGGMVPKLLLAIPAHGWNGQIGLPTRYGDTQNTDVVLKLEKSTLYPGIVELEAMGLDIHKAAGLNVPRYWRVDLSGVPGIAIERFDRDAQRVPLFMESLYSILASADESILTPYDAPYDRIGRALNSPDIQLVTDRKAAVEHLLQRLLLAMLTGNGDLHLANLSLLNTSTGMAFSPVYDPTPMRAYSLHNALVPTGMLFGDYSDYIKNQDSAVGFEQAITRFIKGLGIAKDRGHAIIEKALSDTADFTDRVAALTTLPPEHKQRLENIHADIAQRLRAMV